MPHVPRNLQPHIELLLRHFPVVVLLGARQVGKTELAKTVRPRWKYVDIENPSDLDRLQIDPDIYFSENPHSVIFDEAQEYPELFKILRGVIDRDRGEKGRYILTGSSSPRLLNAISESLAGRAATVEVGTLKANEFFRKPLSKFYELFTGKPRDFCDLLLALEPTLAAEQMRSVWVKGGYPEPVLSRNSEFYRRWMEEYQKSYIERDVRKLFPRINTVRYRKLISILAERSGTILNKSELAQLIEVSQPTVSQYLNIADGTFVWRTLPSFANSKSKSLVKMPKGQLRDSGLLHFLMRLSDSEAILRHSILGRSFEGFIIEEIIKGLNAAGVVGWNYSYYRTRSRAEIDLILEGEFGVIPVEIKFSSKAQSRDIDTMTSFIAEYKAPFGLLINQSSKVERLTSRIIQVPVGLL